MTRSVDEWWHRRQSVTGRVVPYPVGTYHEAWAPYRRLVEQFRPERNHDLVLSQIPPAADVYLVWVCALGHEFVATPSEQRARPGRSRATRSWCPVCATPSLLPTPPRWPARATSHPPEPLSHVSTHRASREHHRTDQTPHAAARPGEAFRSDRASRATSAMEGRLRAAIGERFAVDLTMNAVRVRSPFFGQWEVWPDIVIAELGIAIELDTIGRNADEHLGRREHADRHKDRLLAEVGWTVIRLRCRPLRALDPHHLEVTGVSRATIDALVAAMERHCGALLVRAYERSPAERATPAQATPERAAASTARLAAPRAAQ